jgi:hypothetical protein
MKRDSITYDMDIALGLVQYIAPMDTGNLRYNAIRKVLRSDGFTIKYSLQDAFYIYFLEEGTRKFSGHKGFIGGQTVPAIAGFLYSKYGSKDNKTLNHFRYFAHRGASEIAQMSNGAELRQAHSLNQDIRAIALKNGWETKGIDFYNQNYTRNRMQDYIDVRG